MIEINLLPHREARRAADLRQTAGLLVLGLVVVAGLIAMIDRGIEQDISDVEATVRQLEADIARYKPEEEQVKVFKAKRSELEDKLDVIRGLDRARSGPVRIMDELSKSTPDRLWLTALSTQGVQITVEGDSLDTGVVADFLRSLNASPYFTDVDLDRTSSGAQVEGVKLVHFIITAALADPDAEAEKAEKAEKDALKGPEAQQETAPGADA